MSRGGVKVAWNAFISNFAFGTSARNLHLREILDPGSGELGPGELGPGELGPGEVGPGEVGPGELGPRPFLPFLYLRFQAKTYLLYIRNMIDIGEIAVLSTIFLYSWCLIFSCTGRRHKANAKAVNDTGKVNEKIPNRHANDKIPASSENMVDVKSLEVVATIEQKSYEDKPNGKP